MDAEYRNKVIEMLLNMHTRLIQATEMLESPESMLHDTPVVLNGSSCSYKERKSRCQWKWNIGEAPRNPRP
jgi:hypothetical protein